MARHARVNLSLIMRGIIAGGSTYDNCVPVAARARPKLLGGGATSDAAAFIRFIERRPAARVSQPSCRAAIAPAIRVHAAQTGCRLRRACA